MVKILYVSTLCSQNILDYFFKTAIIKPEQPAQKFHRLIVNGMALDSKCATVRTLTAIPIIPSNHNKKIWTLKSELFGGILYEYIPMLNLKYIKNIGVFIYTFFKVLFWGIVKNNKSKVVICDFLNVTIASASLFACKITRTKIIAIATDLPGMMITGTGNRNSFFSWLYNCINDIILYRFSGYVMLTEYMNERINPNDKPYMVMEGLVDASMEGTKNKLSNKAKDRIIIYAGGLYEKYGIKTLIDAFMMLDGDDLRLHLYGSGPMEETIKELSLKDYRIVFKGMVPNKIVVEDQLKATILVNPRPTVEEFTKYSFPSKNMEYMVSGTPMITTRLPGMPSEYLEFVELFEDESVKGMFETLKNVLNKSREELHSFGFDAKKFVLKNKNNKWQANRILKFSESF